MWKRLGEVWLLGLVLVVHAACGDPADREGALGPVRSIAITSVSVVDVREGTVRTGQTVVVRGERIAAVAPDGETALDVSTRVDGSGKFLIPGLVDSHAHSFADERNARLYLAQGVTTILDMGCPPECTESLRARRWAFDEGRAQGPRIFFTGPNVDGASPFDYAGHVHVSVESAPSVVADLEAMDVDFIKVRDWLSLAEYDAVVDAARRSGLPVIGHVAAAVPVLHALASGQRSISHSGSLLGGFLLAVSSQEDELRVELLEAMDNALAEHDSSSAFEMAASADYVERLLDSFDENKAEALTRELVESRVVLVPTLFVMHPAMLAADPVFDGRRIADDPSMRYVPRRVVEDWRTPAIPDANGGTLHLERSYRRFVELLARWHRAGVPVLAGTDAVFDAETRWTKPGFTLHDELVLLVEMGMTPAEALAAATERPARFLGLDGGIVEAGRVADLVLLTANPLQDIRNTRRIDAVVSNGALFDRAALDEILRASEAP